VIDRQIHHATVENADLVVCRNLPLGSSTEVISARALKDAHEFGEDRHRSELVTTFLTENPDSFDIIGIEPPNAVARPDVRLTVDNPCDLILTRKLWNHVSDAEDPYDLERILEIYDEHDLSSINETKPDGTTDDVIELSWHKFGEPDDRMQILE
jgi:spore coat polysaccharide biosynthesis protein SpsF (cytidylyltransferase family)